ncbi:uncharacterized protein METZ01_LOCUS118426 [marine metagenome]|uniref:CARDB domain-containing protein n=1 Tax=marine metagenome TaxID=408172 RepID=A0A381XM51_9ZZZZ
MDEVRMSKSSIRSVSIALTMVVMLIAGTMITNVDAAASPVTLSSDISEADVMEGNFVEATLTLSSSDTTYRTMEVYLVASWASGVAWTTYFMDTDYNPLEGDKISLSKGGSGTVKFLIVCDGVCSAGDTNTVSVLGKTDPKFYKGSSRSNCGSTDCETDTSAASSSSNVTNTISISITARQAYASTVTCDAASSTGNNQLFQGNTYLWGYTLTNTGWNTDTYQFTSVVTSNSGAEVGFWSVSPGISNGKELTGNSDSSSTAVHSAAGSISIVPASNARPGVYNIELTVTSTNGAPAAGCDFDVVIPEPDLEIKDTDISFSHTGAWINTRGDSQRVTITAKVRNNGGTTDASGTTTTDVEVKFYVDGSQLGSAQTIAALNYGDETTVSVFWNPARAHEGSEVGIPIKVVVDPGDKIEETDQSNNEGSTHFKVVRTKASNPSFYMGFLSLTAAVGAAVLLSTYYRNKEDLED